jgi:hypothetical protein
MNAHDWALALAGVIGSGVAIVHGILTQRFIVTPFQHLAEGNFGASRRRLAPLLLQFSTFNWFIGGIVLVIAAVFFQRQARLAASTRVGHCML